MSLSGGLYQVYSQHKNIDNLVSSLAFSKQIFVLYFIQNLKN